MNLLPLRSKPAPDNVTVLGGSRPSAEVMARPVETLDTPIIYVHGLAQKADTFFNAKNFWCSNPHNTYGGTYSVDTENQFVRGLKRNPGARVFAINLSDNLEPSEKVQDELQRMVSLVKLMTGCPKVDIVTHSMGGDVARTASALGLNRSIRNLIMLAPPSHGSPLADIALRFNNLVKHYPVGKRAVLEGLSARQGNAHLKWLNSVWPQDSKHYRTTIFQGNTLPTPSLSLRLLEPGDGFVTQRSAMLPGANVVLVGGDDAVKSGDKEWRDFDFIHGNHSEIVNNARVMWAVHDIVTGQPQEKAAPRPSPGEQLEMFPELERRGAVEGEQLSLLSA